jgi:hypothetical protein
MEPLNCGLMHDGQCEIWTGTRIRLPGRRRQGADLEDAAVTVQ